MERGGWIGMAGELTRSTSLRLKRRQRTKERSSASTYGGPFSPIHVVVADPPPLSPPPLRSDPVASAQLLAWLSLSLSLSRTRPSYLSGGCGLDAGTVGGWAETSSGRGPHHALRCLGAALPSSAHMCVALRCWRAGREEGAAQAGCRPSDCCAEEVRGWRKGAGRR